MGKKIESHDRFPHFATYLNVQNILFVFCFYVWLT